MRHLTTALLFTAGILASASAMAQTVPPETTHSEIVFNLWKPTPEITIQNVDFVAPLEIMPERFRDFRVTLKPGRQHKLRFSRVRLNYGEIGKTVQDTFTFQGKTYEVDLPVNYDFTWDLYRFGYEWDFIARSHGFVGVIGEAKYNKVIASIDSPLGSSAATDVRVLLPTVGGIARGYLGDYVSVTGEFTGLKLNRETDHGKFYDFDVYGQVNLTKALAIQLGYRSVNVDYVIDEATPSEEQGTFLMKGPYFGGTVRF
jgi:hypothetical protein